jgi:hypothetical protein
LGLTLNFKMILEFYQQYVRPLALTFLIGSSIIYNHASNLIVLNVKGCVKSFIPVAICFEYMFISENNFYLINWFYKVIFNF